MTAKRSVLYDQPVFGIEFREVAVDVASRDVLDSRAAGLSGGNRRQDREVQGKLLVVERYMVLTHATRAPMRLESSFHAFPWSLARHFTARHLCTVSICRHYYLVLPPNLCRFGGKCILIWRQIDIVPAWWRRRSRMAPLRSSRGRRNPPLPRLGVTNAQTYAIILAMLLTQQRGNLK